MLTVNSCFESDCSCKTARIHLPVADVCNANCYYCAFRKSGNISSQAMPGHSRFIPRGSQQIEQYLAERMKLLPECTLIGVSGPGDILSSTAQLRELVEVISKAPYHKIDGCICTNGWDFFSASSILEQWSTLKYITVTINTLQPCECGNIYMHPTADEAFFAKKIAAQKALLQWAAERKILLKINTVLSEFNTQSVFDTWNELREIAPIHIFNLIQMQGQPMTAERRAGLSAAYREIMNQAEAAGFNLKHNCRHCRADSYGRW